MNNKKFVFHKLRVLLIILFFFPFILYSQSNDDCLMCHEDPELTMKKNGKEINISFNVITFKKSAHSQLKCVQCHEGFNPEETPHKSIINKINCLKCHDGVQKKHKFHPQLIKANGLNVEPALNCKGCHGYHAAAIINGKGSGLKYNLLNDFCGSCHINEKKQHMLSVHYEKSRKNEINTPNCLYCHQYPITKGNNLSYIQLKINREKMCLSCHLEDKTKKTKYSKTLIYYENSVHGKALNNGVEEAPSCTNCHGTHNLQKASDTTSTINKFKIPKVCGQCHIGITYEYNNSTHGRALLQKNPDVPSCTYCHGEHNVKKVENLTERVFTQNHLSKLTTIKTKMHYCVDCHTNKKLAEKYKLLTISEAHSWLPNIAKHYETVRCVDCHSSYLPPNLSHNILPPQKTIKKCEECHSKNSVLITKLYKHKQKMSKEKFGFINGTLLSDAYVIGSTRNVFLDTLSIILFSVTVIILILHGLLRWYFRKGKQ